ncbi:hypothetical protein IJ090_01460 [Candidatus Saccharibacteria bacterium]|nr:hypothetical protein [Candidatus Saccharibacteria bacterium]
MKTKQMFVGLGVVAALGAAVVPMTSYAVTDSDSKAVNVQLSVGSTITMALDSSSVSAAVLTSESSEDKTTIATVTSNSASGYTLSAETSSSNGALIGEDPDNTIAYVGANYGSASEGWALSVDDTFKAISGKKISLATSDNVADNEDTTVTYHFKTAATTTPDVYTTTLTYTAAVK